MIRDTFFSQTRFVNLCRKEMVENWKSNLLRVALMYGAMAVIMLWSGYLSYRAVGQDTDSTWEFNLVIFMWGLCVFGCLSASVHNGEDEIENRAALCSDDSCYIV